MFLLSLAQLSKNATHHSQFSKSVENVFLLIDSTDRSKIISDQKRLFIALTLYPLSFYANTPFKSKVYFSTCSLYSLILWVTLDYEIIIIKNLDQYIYFSGSISFAWNGRMMVENKVFKEFKFTSSEIKDLRKKNINILS